MVFLPHIIVLWRPGKHWDEILLDRLKAIIKEYGYKICKFLLGSGIASFPIFTRNCALGLAFPYRDHFLILSLFHCPSSAPLHHLIRCVFSFARSVSADLIAAVLFSLALSFQFGVCDTLCISAVIALSHAA